MGDGMTNKKDDKSTWAIGGGTLIGVGVGFFSYRNLPWHLLDLFYQDQAWVWL
jgi:hypothetical protein